MSFSSVYQFRIRHALQLTFIQTNFISNLAVSQILDSLEDTQWLTISDRLEVNFLQKLFEDKQLRTLLEVSSILIDLFFSNYLH